jgi:hypothetical protein
VIAFPEVEAQALATGAVVAAFVGRGTLTEGDEAVLAASPGPDLDLVQPRFRDLAARSLDPGEFTAVVESVNPAALLDPVAGIECHVWAEPGAGDLVLLRVYEGDGPVIDDRRFEEMRAVVEGALRA